MTISQHEREANRSVTLRVGDLSWASSDAVIDAVLSRRPGVLSVVANAVTGTATVTYDPDVTSVAGLTGWVRDCGFHCAGGSVPEHICDPLAEPDRPTRTIPTSHASTPRTRPRYRRPGARRRPAASTISRQLTTHPEVPGRCRRSSTAHPVARPRRRRGRRTM